MFVLQLRSFAILFLASAIPPIAIIVLIYRNYVGGDGSAVYASISLGYPLFIASCGSTIVPFVYGHKFLSVMLITRRRYATCSTQGSADVG